LNESTQLRGKQGRELTMVAPEFEKIIAVMLVNVSQAASLAQDVTVSFPIKRPPSAALRTAPSTAVPGAFACGLR